MPEGNAVKTMFAGIAAKYDSANHLLSGCFDFYWRYRLSQKVKAVGLKALLIWQPAVAMWPSNFESNSRATVL